MAAAAAGRRDSRVFRRLADLDLQLGRLAVAPDRHRRARAGRRRGDQRAAGRAAA